jgi:hypothetical protein
MPTLFMSVTVPVSMSMSMSMSMSVSMYIYSYVCVHVWIEDLYGMSLDINLQKCHTPPYRCRTVHCTNGEKKSVLAEQLQTVSLPRDFRTLWFIKTTSSWRLHQDVRRRHKITCTSFFPYTILQDTSNEGTCTPALLCFYCSMWWGREPAVEHIC